MRWHCGRTIQARNRSMSACLIAFRGQRFIIQTWVLNIDLPTRPIRVKFFLGRNGAVHGGALGMLFDTVLGLTSSVLTGGPYQRTAYLKIDYRHIVPIEKELQIDAGVDRVEGRKIFVSGRLSDGDTLLTEAIALFVRLKPGQP